jgi:type II secretory pathway component GspD/PulD (secretin)
MNRANLWLWVVGAGLLAAPASAQPVPVRDKSPLEVLQDEQQRMMALRAQDPEDQQRLLAQRAQEPVVEIKEVEPVPLQKILDHFRSQGQLSIDLDPSNIAPDETRAFMAGPDAFSIVFELFLRAADLYVLEETPRYIRVGRPHKVTYSFTQANVRDVIEIIAKEAGANIIVSPDVKGEISLTVDNVPWYALLESVAKTLKFSVVKEPHNVLRVVPSTDLNDQLETRIFTLKYLYPEEPYTAAIKANNQIAGKNLTPPATTKDQIANFPLLKIIEAAMTKVPGGKVVGGLDYAPATHSLVIKDTKPVLDKIAQIIQRLDYEPEQVHVEARFVQTRNTDLFHWGITWSNPATAFGTQDSFGATSDNVSSSTTGKLPFGLGDQFGGGWLNSYDVSLVMRMYREDNFSRVMQQPSLSVTDGIPATIFVGRQIHYAEEVISTSGTGTTAVTTTALREAQNSPVNTGFTLFIIPHIARAEGKVMMTIIPQFDQLSGSSVTQPGFNTFVTQSGGGGPTRSIDLPELTKSTLVTKLALQSGQTVILGGLDQYNDASNTQKLPFLGDIPVLGWLFKGTQQTQVTDHLLIVLTAHVVASPERASEGVRVAFQGRAAADRAVYEQWRAPDQVEEWRKRMEEHRRKLRAEAESLKAAAAPQGQ